MTTTNKRTHFTFDGTDVVLTYTDAYTLEPVTRSFYVRGGSESRSGYVYERAPRDDRQVCNGLASMGPTLSCCRDPDALMNCIRTEYRRMRRAEKAEARR